MRWATVSGRPWKSSHSTGMNGATTVRTTPASIRTNSTQMTQVRIQGPPSIAKAIVSQSYASQVTAETEKATEAN